MNRKDLFVAVCWPEAQELMEDPEFLDNAVLINDNVLYDEYGSASYMVRANWLRQKSSEYDAAFINLFHDEFEEAYIKHLEKHAVLDEANIEEAYL